MQLVEQHCIKKNDNRYKILDEICFKSKNLYNAGLYAVRQHYFETKKFLNYYDLDKKFKGEKNENYYDLPVNVSQQTLKLLTQNFKSFFALIKKKDKKARIPKYLDSKKGRVTAVYTARAFSIRELKKRIY